MPDNPFKIRIETGLRGVIEFHCPDCKRVTSRPFAGLSPGTVITCPCGATAKVGGDSLAGFQRQLDKLKATLGKLGK